MGLLMKDNGELVVNGKDISRMENGYFLSLFTKEHLAE